jgi:hypothetical protein
MSMPRGWRSVVSDDARRRVTVLTAMTPVLTAVAGVVINLATDGKHSWWRGFWSGQ